MKWLLFIISASLPAYLLRFKIGHLPTTVLEMLILTAFLAWLIKKLRTRTLKTFFKNFPRPWLIVTILWLIVSAIAVAISPDKKAALGIWKAYFIEPILLLFVFVDTTQDKKDLKLIFSGLGISALYISVVALLQRFAELPIPAPWQNELRVTSIFEYPNAVGLFLAPLIPTFFGIWNLESGIWKKVFFSVTIMLSISAILLAQSEGAIVGLIIGLFLMGLLWNKKTRIKTIIISIFIAAIIFSIPQTRNFVVEKATLRDWSGLARRITWSETWEMLKDRPILGAGLAGYQKTFAPYHETKAIEIFLYPHNIILNFWSELGVFGFFVFLAIVILFFRATVRGNKNLESGIWNLEPALQASMIVLLIHGLVDVPYFKNDLSVLFWLIIGASLVLNKTKNEDKIMA